MLPNTPASFWSISPEQLLEQLGTTQQGLSAEEARRRLQALGANVLHPQKRAGTVSLLIAQFNSPLILLLLAAAALSLFLGDPTDAIIILVIVLASGLLSFFQEHDAADAVAHLLALVKIRALVRREGVETEIPIEEVVPGDIVLLHAGDTIPGDSRLLESRDLYIDSAALTGETFPVEQSPGIVPADMPLARRTNTLYLGTHVVSGTGSAVVVRTGRATEFGKVAERLQAREPETSFERGVRRFGFLLLEITLLLVIAITVINVYLRRPVLDSLLFALALAVGLTPQLLPAIISINLARGARKMADARVIVKRLASIENFGSMNVLCSDKTGTLTEGRVQVQSALDPRGRPSEKVLLYGYLNACFESGFANPIDEAIRAYQSFDLSAYKKVDEVPYDFIRKRLSILVAADGKRILISKGALTNILDVSAFAENADGTRVEAAGVRDEIMIRFRELSEQGLRTLGVAYREMATAEPVTAEAEKEMTFLGFVTLSDTIKPHVGETIRELLRLGISLKIITGDNRLVAATISRQVGLGNVQVLTGPEIREMSSEALTERAAGVHVFAEVEPNQKERILLALRAAGNVVGYLGDGINDGSALHAADVGISVDSAVDVAKEAADIVLLEQDLGVLLEGVRQGRITFANTIKYVFMATSANFGNMFSMAGASLFLPFLPLLPKQVLLTNLLTDFPETTIATDSVDPELVDQPRRWDLRFIRNFMIVFGLTSSIFDYVTFGVLLWLLRASPDQFRTAWFVESVISASLIVLVIRTRRPFFRSRPGQQLLIATLLVIGVTLLLPLTPLAGPLGFVLPSPLFLVALVAILSAYVTTAEVAKRVFYSRIKA
ncbi:MAG: magnesium-translocating P-type ATPase [Rudaea sp.]